MTKKQDHLSTIASIKFNGTKIELTSKNHFTLKQKVYTKGILIVKNSKASTTSSRGIVCTKQKLYIAQ